MMLLDSSIVGSVTFSLLAVVLVAPASAFQPSSNGFLGCASTCRHVEWDLSHKKIIHGGAAGSTFASPLYSSIADAVESQAAIAADTWSIESTPFMEPDVASQIAEKFRDRGDIVAFQVVGGRRVPTATAESSSTTEDDDPSPGEGRRSRFVLMHPDLGLDAATAETEYCTVIRVENVDVRASNTFPNALASIGVHLDNVGDIVVEDASTVYLVVDPNVAKQCLRLLSKELVGIGIALSVCEGSEFMPHGVMQEMKLSKILQRQMERKKLEEGYVLFG